MDRRTGRDKAGPKKGEGHNTASRFTQSTGEKVQGSLAIIPESSVMEHLRQQRESALQVGAASTSNSETRGVGKFLQEQRELIKGDQVDKSITRLRPDFRENLSRCVPITQPGYATGDQFSIAATLLDNKYAPVFIQKVKPEDIAKDPSKRNQAEDIKKFYISCGIESDRIFVVEDRDKAAISFRQKITELSGRKETIGEAKQHVLNESNVTQYIADYYNPAMCDQIRTAWNLDDSRDGQIKKWLQANNLDLGLQPNSKVVVLWSRFSGKQGAAHPEHDSSYKGIRQIIERLPKGYTVIIAGDPHPIRQQDRKPVSDKKRKKYDKIARKAGKGKLGKKKHVINLTGFWEKEGLKEGLQGWGGDTRIGQLKLYDYINRQCGGNVHHLGFRSGNLEALALIGLKVGYLEEPNAIGAGRMDTWAKNRHLTYRRIEIEKPPTKTGFIVKDQINKERENKRKSQVERLQSEVTTLEKELNEGLKALKIDIHAIEQELTIAESAHKELKKKLKDAGSFQRGADGGTPNTDPRMSEYKFLGERKNQLEGLKQTKIQIERKNNQIENIDVNNIQVEGSTKSPEWLRQNRKYRGRYKRHYLKGRNLRFKKGFTDQDLDKMMEFFSKTHQPKSGG